MKPIQDQEDAASEEKGLMLTIVAPCHLIQSVSKFKFEKKKKKKIQSEPQYVLIRRQIYFVFPLSQCSDLRNASFIEAQLFTAVARKGWRPC